MLLLVFAQSGLAEAATVSQGVEEPAVRGFFAETDVGGLVMLGGNVSRDGGAAFAGYSSVQPYVQLGLGYQSTVFEEKGLVSLGVHGGLGANSQNCYAGLSDVGGRQVCRSSDSFTLTFTNFTVAYLFRLVERLYLGPKANAGLVFLDPSPVAPLSSQTAGSAIGISLGIGASLEYATGLKHFSVGLDIVTQSILTSRIWALQFLPRVQYTF
jgi:hypothetical protein